jgi:DNA-binding transcriptional LysR family regulator
MIRVRLSQAIRGQPPISELPPPSAPGLFRPGVRISWPKIAGLQSGGRPRPLRSSLLAGSSKHSPTRPRRARLEEVANWPLVFYERGSSDWTLTHGLFRRAGLVPNVAVEVDTIETAKRMADAAWAWPSCLNWPWDRNSVPANLRLSSFSMPNLWAEVWTSFTLATALCEERRRHFSRS